MPTPFTLLLTVYQGDREEYLRAAFRSAVDDQTLRPDQVVLVQDGPVSRELKSCMDGLRAGSPVEVAYVELADNRGLGPALDAGLDACRHDVVARMDADDVAMPHRFAVQIPLVEGGADLVGAGMLEFRADLDDVVGRRTPPSDPADIASYARIHDPFNHPTVVYRRSAVIAAGGYGDLPLMEDYWLFIRMIAAGAAVVNIAEPLVYYRIGHGAYERRGGLELFRSELRLQRAMLREGFLSRPKYVRNVVIRGGYRMVPTAIRRPVYRRIVASYGARRNRSRARRAAHALPDRSETPDPPDRAEPPEPPEPAEPPQPPEPPERAERPEHAEPPQQPQQQSQQPQQPQRPQHPQRSRRKEELER